MRSFRGFIAALGLALLATPAGATGFQLDVFQDGQYLGTADETVLGCAANAGKPTADCIGSGAQLGDLGLDNWNFFVDPDPIVTGTVGLTNLAGTTQQFTLLFTLPVAPPIPGATVIGGSVSGSVTDSNGNGATLSTVAGSAFYSALIDGAVVQTLHADPSSVSAGAFLSAPVAAASFGTPIPSQAGPPALTSIAIQIDFTLTAGDQASFTSVFVVEPVPEPATGALLGMGLLGWVAVRRGRRA